MNTFKIYLHKIPSFWHFFSQFACCVVRKDVVKGPKYAITPDDTNKSPKNVSYCIVLTNRETHNLTLVTSCILYKNYIVLTHIK